MSLSTRDIESFALPPHPNGPLSGTASHVNRRGLVAVIWVCFSVSTAFLIARLSVRLSTRRKLLADDIWMILAGLSMLTMCILQTVQQDSLWFVLELAAGRIKADDSTTTRQFEQLARWQFPIIKLFWITLWSVKASFLAIFFRIVQPFYVRRRLWYGAAIFVSLAFLGCVLSSILTCNPVSDYFRAGKCISAADLNRQRFNLVFSTVVDIVSDIIILCIPLMVVASLQLDNRKKIGLAVVFTLGLLVICMSVIRLTQGITGDVIDLVGLTVWGAVETAIAVIVGSLPALSGLVTRRYGKYGHSQQGPDDSRGRTAEDSYSLGSKSRTVMLAECIPLDDNHRSAQLNGRIYVQRMFETHVVENDASSKGSDKDVAVVKTRAVGGD